MTQQLNSLSLCWMRGYSNGYDSRGKKRDPDELERGVKSGELMHEIGGEIDFHWDFLE